MKTKFCHPMRRHYITTASSNASAALSMAKEMQSAAGFRPGVSSLVHIINSASLELIKLCEWHAIKIDTDGAQHEQE